MKFNKVNSTSDLILANYNWWKTPKSLSKDNPFSCYDRDDIINENSYDDNIITELNKYMITTDSQCGLYEDVHNPYPEVCLPCRSERVDIPIEILREAIFDRIEQRAYVSGLMTYHTAIKLSPIFDKYNNDFMYIMFRISNKLILGNVELFKNRIPLTSEYVKLDLEKEIVIDVTNCPNIRSLMKYSISDLNHYKDRLSRKKKNMLMN